MTFDRPAAWLLVVAVPVAWLLHRRLATARELVVSSIDALRDDAASAPRAAPARRFDAALATTLVALAALACAAAGPRLHDAPPRVLVGVDGRAAFRALDAEGRVLESVALDALVAAVHEVDPEARIDIVSLDAPNAEPVDVAAWRARERAAGTARASTVGLALRAAAERRGGALVLSDRELAGAPGLLVRGAGRPCGPDAAIVAAALDGAELVVHVRRAPGLVQALRVTAGDAATETAVPDGAGPLTVRLAAPAAAGAVRVERVGPPDAFDGDDVFTVAAPRAAPRVRVEGAPERLARRLERLVGALGWELAGGHDPALPDVRVVVGGEGRRGADVAGRVLRLALEGDGDAARLVAGAETVPGARLAASGVLSDVLFAPATQLPVTGTLEVRADARGVLAGPGGAVAVAWDGGVECTLDPRGDDAWLDDPAAAVLFLRACGGVDAWAVSDECAEALPRAAGDVPAVTTAADVRALLRPVATRDDDAPAAVAAWIGAAALAIALALHARPQLLFTVGRPARRGRM